MITVINWILLAMSALFIVVQFVNVLTENTVPKRVIALINTILWVLLFILTFHDLFSVA